MLEKMRPVGKKGIWSRPTGGYSLWLLVGAFFLGLLGTRPGFLSTLIEKVGLFPLVVVSFLVVAWGAYRSNGGK